MLDISKKTLRVLCILYLIFIPHFFLFSQETTPCNTKDECELLLKRYEEEIKKYEADIKKTEKDKKTLQNQISILKQKIDKLKLEIEQNKVNFQSVSLQIKDTQRAIEKKNEEIEYQKKKIAAILRTIYEIDKRSLLEILIEERTLSDFFDNLTHLEVLNVKTKELLDSFKKLKGSLEDQKLVLEKEKENLERVLKIQTLQKQEQESLKKEKETLSRLTEAQYQKLLNEKKEIEKEAKRIRARIFELIGVGQAPTFGEAYEIAKYVEKFTGVRPAFLLAVLTQESNIGKNVGQCFLKDVHRGAGIRAKTGEVVEKVMHPTRDVPRFLLITKELGRDPFNTLVSCPMSFGWGGAMGPAQFIPSTWMLYKERVKSITGSSDPWNVKDAFVAAGLFLADYGASQRTREAERKAALIYFSGSANSKYSFYANSVLAIADRYEQDIKILEQNIAFQKRKLSFLNFPPLFLLNYENFF